MTLNDRKIADAEVEGTDSDAFFYYAIFEDTGELLTDVQLDELTEAYPDVIEERVRDKLIMQAEAYWEGDR